MLENKEYLNLLLIISILALFIIGTAKAESIVNKITIKGLEKHKEASILSYIPVEIGKPFNKKTLANITKSLFASGYFSNVELYQNDTELLVVLQERPWISEILLSGNKLVKEEQMLSLLKEQNISKNRSFNEENFEKITKEIESQYYLLGYYGVKISSKAEELKNNRIRLIIQINEGEVSQILKINLIGNKRFSQTNLLKLFNIKTEEVKNLFKNSSTYLRASLEGDIEKLRAFYLDRGHIKFRIISKKVSLSSKQQGIFITLKIEEGEIYKFQGLKVVGHEKIYTDQELSKFIKIKTSDNFSRHKLIATIENIKTALQNKGYALASVIPSTKINEDNKEVFVRININLGKRVYVRRIVFDGNNVTLDSVLRREMRQFEGSLYIPPKVNRSQIRLRRLGFFETIQIQTVPIDDQTIDLLIRVNEQRTGSFNASLGYSQQNDISLKTSIQENNWLGRGKLIKFEIDYQKNSQALTTSYKDSYFSANNVSLLWSTSFKNSNSESLSEDSGAVNYFVNTLSTNFIFGAPINEDFRIGYGIEYSRDDLYCQNSFPICQDFIDEYGSVNNSLRWYFTSSLDYRNRGYFPSAGSKHDIVGKLTTPGLGLDNYTLNLINQFYFALNRSTRNTLKLKSSISLIESYNDSTVPFYKKRFAGGSNSVRGFSNGSLGSNYDLELDLYDGAKGGNLRTLFNLNAYISVIPEDIFDQKPENIKLNLFIDSGYVYENLEEFDLGKLRYSTGLGFLYLSPIGIISFFYALPIDQLPDDELEQFGFSIGSQL